MTTLTTFPIKRWAAIPTDWCRPERPRLSPEIAQQVSDKIRRRIKQLGASGARAAAASRRRPSTRESIISISTIGEEKPRFSLERLEIDFRRLAELVTKTCCPNLQIAILPAHKGLMHLKQHPTGGLFVECSFDLARRLERELQVRLHLVGVESDRDIYRLVDTHMRPREADKSNCRTTD